MKKIYGLLAFGMLVAFVLLFSMVSALKIEGGDIDLNTGYTTITVTEDNLSINATNVYFKVEGNFNVSFDETPFILSNETNIRLKDINFSLTSNKDDLRYRDGINSIIITVNSSEGISKTLEIKIIKDFCNSGEQGNDLEIKNFNVENNGAGSDDEWEMFDEVEVEIEIENTNNDNYVDDVQLEIRILDEEGNDVTSDFLEDDESVDLGRIYEDDDTATEIFNLKVTSYVDEGDYYLYTKAYEEDEEGNNCIDNSDDELNSEFYYEFKVETKEEFKIDELTFDDSIGCGDSQTVYFDLYNFHLGDDEKMRVNLYSSELGIDLYSDSFELDEGDKEDVSFNIEIPENVEEKNYKLKVYVEYNYKESTEMFRDVSDDTEEFSIVVEGNCRIEAPLVEVSLLDEDVTIKAGDIIEMELNLVNQEDEEVVFMLSAGDYSSWASSVKISEPMVTLEEDGATIVKYTLTLKDDLETADYSFNIVVSSEGKELVTQPVAVTVEAKAGLSDLFDEVNWKLIGIVLINLILLIAIILVVRKILKRN